MPSYTLIAVVGVLAAWILFFTLVRRWPRKGLTRALVCPSQNTLARVGFTREEVKWGTFVITGISSCSLFPNGQIDCGKQCLK